jgi:23S rRNA (adenine-N6)-dimethyltransferase
VDVRRARAAPGRHGAGQHFLRSRALVASIVDAAGIEPGDLVLDIGAGRGIISAELVARGARVAAIELDGQLATGLRRRFGDRATVLEHDARRLRPPCEPFKVVANLPFSGATAILRRLLDDPRVPLVSADVVLEWPAAAKRAAVWPTTLLGAYWGAWYELSLVRRLPRCVFAPPPPVDAGILRARRRRLPFVAPASAPAYRRFLERAFAARPRAVVPIRTLKQLAHELGFDPATAARDLDPGQLAALFAASRRSGGGPRP